MSYELTGKIHSIGEVQTFGESFTKREFVLYIENTDNHEWSDYRKLEVIKDKCSLLDTYNVGDEVKVEINLKGRLWTNKEDKEVCFNTDQVWRIEKLNGSNHPTQQVNEHQANQSENKPTTDKEDLPF